MYPTREPREDPRKLISQLLAEGDGLPADPEAVSRLALLEQEARAGRPALCLCGVGAYHPGDCSRN